MTGDMVAGAYEAWDTDRRRAPGVFGLSATGECHRRGAYTMAGVEASDEVRVSRAALVGVAIHAGLLPYLAQVAGAPVDAVEHEVLLTVEGEGFTGHVDLWDAGRGAVVDVKTVGRYGWERVRASREPTPAHLWQAAAYAAALMQAGHAVSTLVWVYVARDTGEDVTVSIRCDADLAVQAIERVASIRTAAADPDRWGRREGPGPSAWLKGATWSVCDGCPWRTRCWRPPVGSADVFAGEGVAPQAVVLSEDADAVAMVAEYAAARADETAAADRKRFAAAVMTGLTPGVYGSWRYGRTRAGAVSVRAA